MDVAPIRHSWFAIATIPILRLLLRVWFFFWGPVRAIGEYRVPKTGPLLILSNHLSLIDPPLVHVYCPRRIHYMASTEIYGVKILLPLLRYFRVFPVNPGTADRGAIRHAVKALKEGEAVGVFPEGELNKEPGTMLPILSGAGLIAKMSGATIICCGLQETNRIIPYGCRVPRPAFRRITITWGEPRQFDKDVPAEQILEWVQHQLLDLSNLEPSAIRAKASES